MSLDTVEYIAQGYVFPLKSMPQHEAFVGLEIEIGTTSKLYGARYEITGDLLKECVRVVLRNFSDLGLMEIRQAFRELHSGTFEAKGAESYGGEFSAAQLAKTLSAYSQFRKEVVSKMIALKNDEIESQIKTRKAEAARKKFEQDFPREVHDFAQNDEKDWRDIPVFWYDAALKREMFAVSDQQKRTVWSEAKQLAEADQEEQSAFSLDKITAKYKAEERSIVIAKKLIVFRYLILPKRKKLHQSKSE